MRLTRHLALMLLIVLSGMLSAQEIEEAATTDNRQINLPDIGVNFGIVNLMSDVKLEKPGPSPFTQFGYQLTVSQRVARFLNVSLNIFTGTVYGEEMRNLTNLNYRTSLFSQQLNLEYNFYPLLKPGADGRQLIRPYIGVGAGAMFFRSKGDLRDAEGRTYHYWEDGTIRDRPQTGANAEGSVILQRDMVYDSDLRDADLDGLRKYPQTTFTLPFHAGVRFQLTKNFGVNAAFTYAMNFSDMLDNSGANSIGDRQSSSGNDHHMFGSVGVNFFLGTHRPSAKKPEQVELAKSVNRWATDPKKQEEKDAKAEDDGLTSGQDESPEDSSTDTGPSTSPDKGVDSIEGDTPETGDSSKDSARDAGSADQAANETASPAASMLIAFRSDGSTVEVVPQGKVGADGTPVGQLFDVDGKPLSADAAAQSRVAYRADGTVVELIPKDIIAVDGTPTIELRDADGRTLTPSKAVPSQVAYLADGTPVKVTAQGVVGADGTSVEELVDAKGNLIPTGEAVPSRLAYHRDGRPVELVAKDVTAIDGTPIGQLFDAQGNALTPQTAFPPAFSYREDGTIVETGGTAVMPGVLSDTEGVAVDATESPSDADVPQEVEKEKHTPVTAKPRKEASGEQLTLSELEKVSPKLSGTFHWADRDGNGYITADEVLYFIDQLFDGDGKLTVEDIQDLIDFYFDQE